ncbi:MAG: HigA family addiction module antidote protein [Deltaproteobacteria bacterium]|nr:HigA family addiction module antidote protein [Deltaproteobacteria bacterium]
MGRRLQNIHPGDVLGEEFLKPLEVSAYRLAKEIGVPATRVSEILHGRRAITADTALERAQSDHPARPNRLGRQPPKYDPTYAELNNLVPTRHHWARHQAQLRRTFPMASAAAEMHPGATRSENADESKNSFVSLDASWSCAACRRLRLGVSRGTLGRCAGDCPDAAASAGVLRGAGPQVLRHPRHERGPEQHSRLLDTRREVGAAALALAHGIRPREHASHYRARCRPRPLDRPDA